MSKVHLLDEDGVKEKFYLKKFLFFVLQILFEYSLVVVYCRIVLNIFYKKFTMTMYVQRDKKSDFPAIERFIDPVQLQAVELLRHIYFAGGRGNL